MRHPTRSELLRLLVGLNEERTLPVLQSTRRGGAMKTCYCLTLPSPIRRLGFHDTIVSLQGGFASTFFRIDTEQR